MFSKILAKVVAFFRMTKTVIETVVETAETIVVVAKEVKQYASDAKEFLKRVWERAFNPLAQPFGPTFSF